MKKYSDYQKDKNPEIPLTKEELLNHEWLRYKIIVPTKEEKQEMMDALEHFHDEGYDGDLIANNQLAHEYLEGNNIIVDDNYGKEVEVSSQQYVKTEKVYLDFYSCSNCSDKHIHVSNKYCPNCGVKINWKK